MSAFADHIAADQRLTILQALEEDPDYAINEHLLRAALDEYGHGISSDKLRTELYWLAEQGLVTLEEVAGVKVARLTSRGEDVALGRARVPGVARPRPGA